jgi:hypothetical protein
MHIEVRTISRKFVIIYIYEVKKDEMGGACGTNGGEEECI